jgi:DNA-directed RNA polymerase subunit RPC12/RpoP
MPASRVPTRQDWIVNIVVVALAVGGLFAAGLLLGRTHPAVFIGAALIVLFLLVRWHAGATAYLCENCGREFTLSPLQDLLSPHTPTSKRARCPHCGQRNWNRTRVRE